MKLIEFFSGVGFTSMALKKLVPFSHHRTSDWNIPSVISYANIHFTKEQIENTKKEVLETMDKDTIVNNLFKMQVSADSKSPMTKENLTKKNIKWLLNVYTCFKVSNNLGSITKIKGEDLEIDNSKDKYLLSYSYPCQSISLAGKGEGMSKGSGTRSGLLWEVERILLESSKIENGLPQILLMENVTQVHGKKHLADFEMWIKFLESLGYKNYWADLNAKHYGVPQNRDRTFMVSILGEHRYFMFPDKQLLKTKLKDILEKEVGEKYYLDTKAFEKLKDTSPIESQNVNERFFKQAYETLENNIAKHGDTIDAFNEKLNVSGVSPTITTRPEGFKTAILPVIAASRGRNIENPSDRTKGIELEQRLEINKEGLSNTLTTVQKDNYVLETVFTETQDAPTINTTTTQTSFIVKEEFTELQKKVAEEALRKQVLKPYDVIDYTYSNSRLSEIEKGFIKIKNKSDNNVMSTLTTNAENFGVVVGTQIQKPRVRSILGNLGQDNKNMKMEHKVDGSISKVYGFRIRKLTSKECWRLMGATDEEFEKAEKGLRKYLYNGKDLTNSQLYHQAGNGIVVNVLVELFKQILKSVGE